MSAKPNETGRLSLYATSNAVVGDRRVKLNTTTGKVELAGVGDVDLGVCIANPDDTLLASVHTLAGIGTVRITLAAAATVGQALYAAADGKVAPTGTGTPMYRALEAGGNGEAIECLPLFGAVWETAEFTVSSAQASANSGNGQGDFDLGIGVVPRLAVVEVEDAITAGLLNTGYTVTKRQGGDAGQVRVAGAGGGAQLDAGDIVRIAYIRG